MAAVNQPRPLTLRSRRRTQPKFFEAVVADARTTYFHSGQHFDTSNRLRTLLSIVRLAWSSDGFLAQIIYRFGSRMWGLGVPLLPRIARAITMAIAQLSIGDTVIVRPGVCISHGYAVIAGFSEIRSGSLIAPFVTIGLIAGDARGPTIGHFCTIGTGTRVLGPVVIGNRAKIGTNAVVVDDVPEGAVAVGVPARVVEGAGAQGDPAPLPGQGQNASGE
jgi:serine O-acetyltransferase